MKAQHTQGQWKAYKIKESNGFWYVDSPDTTSGTIATCYNTDAEANAKLIAAAPDLLDALINAMPYIRHSGLRISIDKAEAAIKKATE